jgi:Na+-driven multidrug efflux pump
VYHSLFDKAQHGMNFILISLVLIFACAIAAQLIVRSRLANSNRSKASKRALENLASVVVIGLLGIVMLIVLGHMK